MIHSAPRYIALSVAVLLSTATLGLAQEKEKTVKKVPIENTSPASGEEMYNSYCAVCHGKDAKGGGPAAAALKVAPSDLTTLAKSNNGKFPEDHVTTLLRNGIPTPAHGSADMPIWGPLFASVSGRDQSIVNLRISNLIRYLESVQVK